MVTLELQLPSKQQCHSTSLQEVDAVAALQQLGLQQYAARVNSRTASSKRPVIHTDDQAPPSAAQLHQNVQGASQETTTGRHSVASKAALSLPSSGRQSIATTFRDTPHSYASDGVRLFEQGEQFLYVGSPRPPLLEEQELSFSLPAELDASSSSNHVPIAAGDSQKPQRRKYVCSVKDDPLVKGRLASSTCLQVLCAAHIPATPESFCLARMSCSHCMSLHLKTG